MEYYANLSVALGLAFVCWQLYLQRRTTNHQTETFRYGQYQKLCERYQTLLWEATRLPEVKITWNPLSPKRKEELKEAQDAQRWGAWYIFTEDERNAYRWIRQFIELFDQVIELKEKDWIDQKVWKKWKSWIELWTESDYFEFVYKDCRGLISESLRNEIDEVLERKAQPVGVANT